MGEVLINEMAKVVQGLTRTHWGHLGRIANVHPATLEDHFLAVGRDPMDAYKLGFLVGALMGRKRQFCWCQKCQREYKGVELPGVVFGA